MLAGNAMAQKKTMEIRNGEVLAVEGNLVVVRGPEGVKEFLVSDEFKFDMGGKMITVHELKPGMRFTAMITTTETPVEMTQTDVRSGEVVRVVGTTLIIRNQEGKLRKFTLDEMRASNIVVYKKDKAIEPSSLKPGDKFSATVVTKLPPETITEQELAVLVAAPPPPRRKPPQRRVAATTAPPPPKPKQLPKTASPLPLVGLTGLVSLLAGGALTIRRRYFG